MNAGIGYIVCNAKCHLCGYEWVGVVEVDYIEIGGVKEFKKPTELECSKCGSMTDNFKIEDNNEVG